MDVLVSFADYLAKAFNLARVNLVTTEVKALSVVTAEELLVVRSSADQLISRSCVVEHLRRQLNVSPVALLACNCDELIPNARQLGLQLTKQGLKVSFCGWLPSDFSAAQHTMIAVLESGAVPARCSPPSSFRVVVFMAAYNEEDIIDETIRYLAEENIDVYLIDNWSTDSTYDRASAWLGKGLIGMERFPEGAPTDRYDWRQLLGRIEQLSQSIPGDWFVLHDCDERRLSPWPEVGYKAGIYHADRCGFNCIDHVVLNYWPTQEQYDPRRTVETQLTSCSFSDHPGHFHQRKAWKKTVAPVLLAASAGHDVTFPGRQVYPFKFLLKHFPIRSQAQAERKIFRDRKPRWNPEERANGWHAQYDGIAPGQRFAWDPTTLSNSDDPAFYERFLVERISGVGVFHDRPSWATKP